MHSMQPTIPFLLRNSKNSDNRRLSTIRKDIDDQIKNICDIIKRKNQSSRVKAVKFQIPKLQNKLVKQYVMQVYHDYSIKDPLSQNSKNYYQSPSNSFIKTGKKAIQLKKQFIKELINSVQTIPSPTKQTQRNVSTNTNISTTYINETFRYCFICQQPILQANILYHQRNKCPYFSTLYKMTLLQIKQLLQQKIKKIREQIRNGVQRLKQRQQFQKLWVVINNRFIRIIGQINNEKQFQYVFIILQQ